MPVPLVGLGVGALAVTGRGLLVLGQASAAIGRTGLLVGARGVGLVGRGLSTGARIGARGEAVFGDDVQATIGLRSMRTRTRYKRNRNFERQLKRSPQYAHGMRQIAERAADAIRDQAPVRTGAFRDSIEVDSDGDTIRIFSADPAAHIIEFGSVRTEPHAPFRRGIRRAGLRLEEGEDDE